MSENPPGRASTLTYLYEVVKHAVVGLFSDKCLRSSAALSFYTLFSIAPMIYMAVYVAGLWAADVDFQTQISDQFSALLGDQAAMGITVLLETIEHKDQSRFQLIVGSAVLAFSATNIFIQIQTTFNEIFGVQARENVGFLKKILDRVISLGVVVSLGFLLIVSLVLDSLVLTFHGYLFAVFNDVAFILVQLSQLLLLTGLITGVVYLMFQFLPDVVLTSRYKFRGSLVVACMLLLGKYAISLYIAQSNLSELGGASASVIILMLWVYYTSLILFLGAELVSAMAAVEGRILPPRRYATRVRTVIVSENHAA